MTESCCATVKAVPNRLTDAVAFTAEVQEASSQSTWKEFPRDLDKEDRDSAEVEQENELATTDDADEIFNMKEAFSTGRFFNEIGGEPDKSLIVVEDDIATDLEEVD